MPRILWCCLNALCSEQPLGEKLLAIEVKKVTYGEDPALNWVLHRNYRHAVALLVRLEERKVTFPDGPPKFLSCEAANLSQGYCRGRPCGAIGHAGWRIQSVTVLLHPETSLHNGLSFTR